MLFTGAQCGAEETTLISQHSQKFVQIDRNGRVRANSDTASLTQKFIISSAVTDGKIVSGGVNITIYAENVQRYLCFTPKWHLTGLKNITAHQNRLCHFAEKINQLGNFQFVSVIDPRIKIGFTKGGKAINPTKKQFNENFFNFEKCFDNCLQGLYSMTISEMHQLQNKQKKQKSNNGKHRKLNINNNDENSNNKQTGVNYNNNLSKVSSNHENPTTDKKIKKPKRTTVVETSNFRHKNNKKINNKNNNNNDNIRGSYNNTTNNNNRSNDNINISNNYNKHINSNKRKNNLKNNENIYNTSHNIYKNWSGSADSTTTPKIYHRYRSSTKIPKSTNSDKLFKLNNYDANTNYNNNNENPTMRPHPRRHHHGSPSAQFIGSPVVYHRNN